MTFLIIIIISYFPSPLPLLLQTHLPHSHQWLLCIFLFLDLILFISIPSVNQRVKDEQTTKDCCRGERIEWLLPKNNHEHSDREDSRKSDDTQFFTLWINLFPFIFDLKLKRLLSILIKIENERKPRVISIGFASVGNQNTIYGLVFFGIKRDMESNFDFWGLYEWSKD